jgi:hypothetical protein
LAKALERRMDQALKMAKVFRDAVRQSSLEVIPDQLIRIEIRRVGRQTKYLKSRMVLDESFY